MIYAKLKLKKKYIIFLYLLLIPSFSISEILIDGILDEDEWNAMLISFKTLFKEPKHLEIWEFIKITFAEDFVELVDEQIKQSKLYG